LVILIKWVLLVFYFLTPLKGGSMQNTTTCTRDRCHTRKVPKKFKKKTCDNETLPPPLKEPVVLRQKSLQPKPTNGDGEEVFAKTG